MYLNKIMDIIPIPESPVYTGDSKQISKLEETLKIELPKDYYELIKNYGAGYFGGHFIVYNPFVERSSLNLIFALNESKYYYECAKKNWNIKLPGITINGSDSMLSLFENQRNINGKFDYCGDEFDNVGHPFSYFPEKEGLFPCAEYNGEYTIYWKTSEEKWTIVVYGGDYYSEFDMTLTEFLYKLIIGEFNMNSLRKVFTLKGLVFEKYVEQ